MPIIKRDELPWGEIAHELAGAEHGLGMTLLFVDAEPGRGPALHRHPYAEVLIVQEGEAEADITLDGERHEARAGDILVVLPTQAHSFVNSGSGPLPPDRHPPEPELQHGVARGPREEEGNG
jgi:mannose-6-phosphate isomerase-like protein (cupin superfamily)